MTAWIFIFTVCLSFILHLSQGYFVHQTLNPDGLAVIRCEHNSSVSATAAVQLNGITPNNEFKVLWQEATERECKNVKVFEENSRRYLFILLNISEEALSLKYQCEFTVKEGGLFRTAKGTPTRLGQREVGCEPQPQPPPPSRQLLWSNVSSVLVALLTLAVLYSFIITSVLIHHKCSRHDLENSTYVEMKKAPPRRRPEMDMVYE